MYIKVVVLDGTTLQDKLYQALVGLNVWRAWYLIYYFNGMYFILIIC